MVSNLLVKKLLKREVEAHTHTYDSVVLCCTTKMCDEMILIKLILYKFIVENIGDDILLHRTSQHPKVFSNM